MPHRLRPDRRPRHHFPAALPLLARCSASAAPRRRRRRRTTSSTTLQPTRGNTAAGTVWFSQERRAVSTCAVAITGLKPNQEHGFHIHEKGDCSSGDGMSAGGHLNPNGKPHGPPTGEHHAGDLPRSRPTAPASRRSTVRVPARARPAQPIRRQGADRPRQPRRLHDAADRQLGRAHRLRRDPATPGRAMPAGSRSLPLPRGPVDAPFAPWRRRADAASRRGRAGAAARRRRAGADRRGVAVRRRSPKTSSPAPRLTVLDVRDRALAARGTRTPEVTR